MVTSLLSKQNINIATMKIQRDKRGGIAVMIIECDQELPSEVLELLRNTDGVLKVTYINAVEA